jgi:hypothetical protein
LIRETDQLQPALLLRLPHRIPTLRVFSRNIATVRIQGRTVKFGIKGMPDIYGIQDGGKHIEVEIKASRGRLSPEQDAFRTWCAIHCVPYVLAIAEKTETIEQTVERWCTEIKATLDTAG